MTALDIHAVLLVFALSPMAALSALTVPWEPDAALQWPDAAVRALALHSGLWVPGAAQVRAVAFGPGRAFACMPRWRPGVAATLAWAPWPAAPRYAPLRPFPSWPAQFAARCTNLQSVVGAAVGGRDRLWVLDEGAAGCPPKFLVFEWRLRVRPIETARHAVRHAALGEPPRHLAVDGELAYASAASAPALLVFSLRERASWVVRARPLGPLALVNGLLFATARDGETELMALPAGRLHHAPWNGTAGRADGEVVGSLLGPAWGLCAHPKGALIYFLQRDHAVVSWDTSAVRPVRAEAHRVLLQDAALLPRVAHIAVDVTGTPWALAVGPNGSATSVRLPML
nr:yellow-k protein [Ischnura senegalensis]